MLTLDLFQQDKFILAGLLHAVSIHFRLYPIIFSIPMYFSLNGRNALIPNKNQLKLVLSCVSFITFLTAANYYFYGYKYLYESLIYHMIRKDTKHNFSVFFYMLYLSANHPPSVIQKIFTFLPQLLLLLLLSYKFSRKPELPFAMFAQAMVMVTYNPVLTSQYFFWYLSLLPLCLPHFGLSITRSIVVPMFYLDFESGSLVVGCLLVGISRSKYFHIYLDFEFIIFRRQRKSFKRYHCVL